MGLTICKAEMNNGENVLHSLLRWFIVRPSSTSNIFDNLQTKFKTGKKFLEEVTNMKKTGKSTKKGFTLVELIVVLVILAVLAAMLVPGLIGYIDRARAEKEYQTAATVYTAAQSVLTELYARDALTDGQVKIATDQKLASMGDVDAVKALAGVDADAVSAYLFDFDASTHIITGGTVTIGDSTYTLTITDGVPSWTAATTAPATPAVGG